MSPQATEYPQVLVPKAYDIEFTAATGNFPKQNGSLCYFCGLRRHPRRQCPARDAVCKGCGNKQHYERVCQSSRTIHSAAISESVLSSTTVAAAPVCLSDAVVEIYVNGIRLQALVNTGSLESYISHSGVQAHKWEIHSSRQKITMASTSLSSFTLGHTIHSSEERANLQRFFRLESSGVDPNSTEAANAWND
ncbi:hypothetical protein EG68_11244 [Paragonimus skrjabini miyazakii]|uniref:CCHC-type domain-containing protein n=1 Tax=Paragonimus skrjabini miyazakii TaxID=59628 RepID=A0A8S9YQI7_9TREM|nr:hypothetical protein EG68_11244 [Paragonimus skrjabini miyazakii]